MRVVILNQYYAPDDAPTGRLAADLGAYLAASGYRVIAICANRAYRDRGRKYTTRETIDGVEVRRVCTTAFGRTSRLTRVIDATSFFMGAAIALLRVKSDVVLTMTAPPMIAWIPLILRRPFIVWSMDVYPELAFRLGAVRRTSIAGRLLSRIANAICRSASSVIALDGAMAAHLETDVVIHNWSDLECGGSPPPPSEFTVAYSGNFGLPHEFETVIAAVRKLQDIQFIFAGGGPRLAEVRDALRGASNVEFRDFADRSRAAESIAAASVHLVTLRPDMAGLVVPSKIYGILAAGRPAIYVGPADGAVHDIISTEHCGESVRNGDVASLVRAICNYADDRSRCERDGRNARAAFDRSFRKETSLAALASQIRRATAS